MRPGQNNDKTKRPDSNGINDDKTLRPGEATLRADTGNGNTSTGGNGNRRYRPDATRYSSFTVDAVLYKVKEVIAANTGESQVFKVENNGNIYALKVYFANVKLPEIRVRETICKAFSSKLLVATYSYGKLVDPLDHMTRDFELMEYCPGGTLEGYKVRGDEKLLGEVALKCAVEIDYLHNKHIIHRDIKPANFFFRSEKRRPEYLTLADFGIAVMADDKGKAEIDYQPRTYVYTAPEYYYSVDGHIQISYKSDFYALGMMLLSLWDNSSIAKLSEYELIELKRTATLPYPKDVSDHMLQLLKALTDTNPATRASLTEIIKWSKGEKIFDLKKHDESVGFNIVFNQSKNQVARSAVELGRIMFAEQELAKKYLYSGKLAEWLTNCKAPELAIEMEDIVENQYPQDKDAGLKAACYFLDPQMPYMGIDGSKCSNKEQIGEYLLKNIQKMAVVLKNPSNNLFVYMNAHGGRQLVQTFIQRFKNLNDSEDVVRQLAYTLNPQLPWTVHYSNKPSISYTDIKTLLKDFDYQGCTNPSWDEFTTESFLQWVGKRDPVAEGRIRSQAYHNKSTWCVLYNLDLETSFEFVYNKRANNYYFTAFEIGCYLDRTYVALMKDPNNKAIINIINQLSNIDGSRIYFYLKSKGNYDSKIAWIKYCMDIDSKENKEKYGPYDKATGIYKCIKGLGVPPSYYFRKLKKSVISLDQLKSISNGDLKYELNNGTLISWISTFFQENPSLDLKPLYAFEKESVKMLEYVATRDPNYRSVQRFNQGRDIVKKLVTRLRFRKGLFRWLRILLSVLMVATTSFASYMLVNDMGPFKSPGGWVVWVCIIVGVLAGYGSMDSKGCLLSALIGFIVYGVLVAFMTALFAYGGYVLSIALIAWLIWVLYKFVYKNRIPNRFNYFINTGIVSNDYSNLINPGFKILYLEPLHFAYKYSIADNFYSSIEAQIDEAVDDHKPVMRKLLKNVLILIAVTTIIGGFYVGTDKLPVLTPTEQTVDYERVKAWY